MYSDYEMNRIVEYASQAPDLIKELRERIKELEEQLADSKKNAEEWEASSGQWEKDHDALAEKLEALHGAA